MAKKKKKKKKKSRRKGNQTATKSGGLLGGMRGGLQKTTRGEGKIFTILLWLATILVLALLAQRMGWFS